MSKLTNNSKNVVLIILSICMVISFFWIRSLLKDQKFSSDIIQELKAISYEEMEIPETEILRDIDVGTSYAKTEIVPKLVPQNSMPKNIVRYYEDTVKAAILKLSNEKKNIEIASYMKTIGKLKGDLNAKNSLISQIQDSTLIWQNKYITIRSNFKDQTSSYEYDADFDFTVTKEKGKEYLYATSKDSSFTFNKNYIYKKKILVPKNSFRLMMENRLDHGFVDLTNDNRPRTFQFRPFSASSGLRLYINPDGFLQPNFGGSYAYDFITGRSYIMGSLGLDLKLIER